jgi:hypothetical protein
VSILHSRIIRHGGQQPGNGHPGPAVMPETPHVMPLALVSYQWGTGYYQDLYPSQLASGDVNAVPLAVTMRGPWGEVMPAGRFP